MTMHTQIAAAERAGDVFELAAIARSLLAELAGKPATAKPKAPSRRLVADEYLTNTERRARGLPDLKEGKIGGAPYRYVLVEFAGGYKSLCGYYPRAKNPDDLAPAIISARARYLGILSGRFLDARYAGQVPRVTGARVISDPVAIDAQRRSCMALRREFEGRENARRAAEHALQQVGIAFRHRNDVKSDVIREIGRKNVRGWIVRTREARMEAFRLQCKSAALDLAAAA